MKKNMMIFFLTFVFLGGIVHSAHSAGDAFLYLSGVEGESLVKGYEKWIDLLSWSWELSNDDPDSGSGKAIVGPIKVIKYIDKSSPFLTLFVLTGKHTREGVLVLRKGGDKPFEYLEIKMWNVEVVNVSPGGMSTDNRGTETVALDFSRVCYTYTPQKPDGSPDAEITKCFDIVRNKPFS